MPRQIRLDGIIHSFPDDASDDEIKQALDGGSPKSAPNPGAPPLPTSVLPQLNSQWDALKFGASQAASGAYDSLKGMVQMANPVPQNDEERKAMSVTGIPIAAPLYRMGKGIVDLAKQSTQVPAALRDIANSPAPLAALATTAPYAGGQGLAQLATAKVASDPAAVVRAAAKTYNAGLSAGQTVAPAAGLAEAAYLAAKGNHVGALTSAVSGGMLGKVLKQLPEAPASMTEFGSPAEVLNKVKAYAEKDTVQPVPLKLPGAKGDPYSGGRVPPMEPAQSGTIGLHGYHPESQTMMVQFKNGKVYELRGVPQEVYDAYKNSESQGSFYQQNLKGRYTTNFRGNAKGAK